MKRPHLLLAASNVRRVRENLIGTVNQDGLDAIDRGIELNVSQLVDLGMRHFKFADGVAASDWRQSVSRLYYAAYHAARAVRLFVAGDYSEDASDHKRWSSFADFPDRERFATEMATLRDDRNTCDYDHTATIRSLVHEPSEALILVRDFLEKSRTYLRALGVKNV